MTVGAVPDYVKLQAALFADGSSSGIPDKVTRLVERWRMLLDTTRQLLRRLEKAGPSKAEQMTDLKQWADSLQPSGKPKRDSQAFINQAAARGLIADTASKLNRLSLEETITITGLREAERALTTSKPTL